MKSFWIAGVAVIALLPSLSLAETVYSSISTIDPVTGESSVSESATQYQVQSPATLYVPSAPVERSVYEENRSGKTHNLADEQAMDKLAPAARTGETDPADTAINEDVLTEHRTGNVTYITGGVGHAERTALDALRGKYNFKLTNTETGGAFVSYTHVSLTDAKGNEVLSAEADPIFFAQLPPGKYSLRAEHEGQIKNQAIQIKSGKPVNLQLGWM